MAAYLLDTGPLVGLLNGRPGAVALIQPWMLRHEVTTSVLAVGEASSTRLAAQTRLPGGRRS